MKSIYFDLDDTLIYTQYKFNQAAVQCLQALNECFGVDNPHPKMVMDHFIDLELNNAEEFGFKKIRFANSWVNTYRYFVDRLDYDYDKEMENKIWEIANQVNEPPFLAREDAFKAIKKVRPLAKEMFIYTMGDKAVQEDKVRALPKDMINYFDDLIVVPKKDINSFKKVMDDRHPKSCVMVGNSARSDIFPAIKNGAYAIHIPTETWTYDLHHEPFYYPRLYTIPSIKQLPTILKAINEE